MTDTLTKAELAALGEALRRRRAEFAEETIRYRVKRQWQADMDRRRAARPKTPAFDVFWDLKGGCSPLGLFAGGKNG